MPLQNRADPLGNIIANTARGTLMENRGRLHNEHKQIGQKRWTTQSWVTCTLSFGGRKRELMAPDNYTELFFLDEATALAAGHRPCGECRRENHKAFVAAWKSGHGLTEDHRLTVKDIDTVMHRERREPIEDRSPADLNSIPDGAMVANLTGQVWIKWTGGYYPWSFDGYGSRQGNLDNPVILVTPASTTSALRAGYSVAIHPSLSGR